MPLIGEFVPDGAEIVEFLRLEESIKRVGDGSDKEEGPL